MGLISRVGWISITDTMTRPALRGPIPGETMNETYLNTHRVYSEATLSEAPLGEGSMPQHQSLATESAKNAAGLHVPQSGMQCTTLFCVMLLCACIWIMLMLISGALFCQAEQNRPGRQAAQQHHHRKLRSTASETHAQHNQEWDSSGKLTSVGTAVSIRAILTVGASKPTERVRFSWEDESKCLQNLRNCCTQVIAFFTWSGSMYSNL